MSLVDAHLRELCSKNGEAEIDIKDLVSRYAMDAIGACAMGIKCNAIKDPENCQMKKAVKQIFRISWKFMLLQICMLIHPKLVKILGLAGMTGDLAKFLTSVTKQAMEMKTKAGHPKKDFLQIMMNASESETQDGKKSYQNGDQSIKSKDPVFTEKMITGVIATFLSAGLDPVASAVTFALYELAFHPEMQDRLHAEIQAAKNKSSGEIEFDDIKDIQYLEQVLCETLRLYPPAGFMFRYCRESFPIPESSVVVEKTVNLLIPQLCIQRDPKYFSDPERFDPERFSRENIDKIVPGTYLPFGEGPRFCIETLRLYPPAGFMFRHCREPFVIPDSSVVVERTVNLLIPQLCIQRDPKYFSDPERFDPERFSRENIDKIVPGTYLPFGEGPRFCIGNRFAIMSAKTMLITLISGYTVHPCAKTKNRMTYDKETFTLSPEGSVWLRIKKRS